MNERKLSPEQIGDLHEFCYCHSVWHYDVQVELVDHLATTIEDLWKNNPGIPFDKAMRQVGNQFGGVLAFATIRQEKEKALRKKYRRLLLQFVADYYKFPKIIVTILLTLSFYSALFFSENDQWIIIPLVVVFYSFLVFYSLYYKPRYVQTKTKKGYAFMLNEISMNGLLYKLGTGFSGISISLISHAKTHFSTTGSLVFSVLISFFLVLIYGDCFFVPKKIREHLQEQFPQFVKF